MNAKTNVKRWISLAVLACIPVLGACSKGDSDSNKKKAPVITEQNALDEAQKLLEELDKI